MELYHSNYSPQDTLEIVHSERETEREKKERKIRKFSKFQLECVSEREERRKETYIVISWESCPISVGIVLENEL